MAAIDGDQTGRHHGEPGPPRTGAAVAQGGVGERSRSAVRRRARSRRRRRAVEGLTLVVCLVGLVTYLGRGAGRESGVQHAVLPGGPAGVQRPVTVERPPTVTPAVASPGLNPRVRPVPTPPPTSPVLDPSPSPQPSERQVLTVARVDLPATVDLTADGPRDWVHLGLRGADSTVRKRDGSGAVTVAGGRGTRSGHDTNPEFFGWRDGAEVAHQAGTPHGVHTCGVGNGFLLTVAGDGEIRTVRIYVGVWMAQGRLTARLGPGGPTAAVESEDPHTEHTTAFDVRFRAAPGDRLSLSWTTVRSFDPDCGSVSLQAVALR
ncbi:hypothetical protein ABT336_05750 [Micromonospora sp. NPDC000207]|uniref:hypothetical protein n=1 Tax=Micromonospora sp. NPDC000207 TaxID=3154246 RepID=UPI00332C0022